MAKERLDQLMCRRGLCDSREAAKRLVLAGEVRVEGVEGALKPGMKIVLISDVTAKDAVVSSVQTREIKN